MTLLKIPVFQLPLFTGFYESIFKFEDELIKSGMELVNLDGTPATKPDDTLVDDWYLYPTEWYEKEVAARFAAVLEKYFTNETFRDGSKMIGVVGTFNFTGVTVDSPTYYNYRNDTIQTTLNIESSGLQFLIDFATSETSYAIRTARGVTETKTIKQAFIDYVNKCYSSRNGFHSYVDNEALKHVGVLQEYLKDPLGYDFNSKDNRNILVDASYVEVAIVVLLDFLIEGYLAERYQDDYSDSLLLAAYYAIDTHEIAMENYSIEVTGVDDASSVYRLV